jgi:hypothetical protein
MYRELNIKKIIDAIHLLSQRINDRFPDSNLLKVSEELGGLAQKTKDNIYSLNKPYIYFRVSFILLVIISIAAIVYTLSLVSVNKQDLNLQNIIFTSEALLNEAVMIGAAFYFICSFLLFFNGHIE